MADGPTWATRFRGALAIYALIVPGVLLWAQGPAANEDRVRFRALEELERKEKLLEIRKRLLFESNAREMRVREVQMILDLFQSVPALPTDDDRVTAYIRARRLILETLEELAADRLRRLEVMDLIRDVASGAATGRADLEFLRESQKLTQNMLDEQARHEARLRTLGASLQARLAQVPPPGGFRNDAGMDMVLVGEGDGAFYVSAEPVRGAHYRAFLEAYPEAETAAGELARLQDLGGEDAVSGVTWVLASAFCRWLSDEEKSYYALPVSGMCERLSERLGAGEVVWTSTEWKSEDMSEQRVAERFGIHMYELFDPGHVLSDADFVRELPVASYDQVALRVVTGQTTGRKHRWNRLVARDRALRDTEDGAPRVPANAGAEE